MEYSYLCKVFELIGYMIYGEWFYIFVYVQVLKLYLMNTVDHIYIYETVSGELYKTTRLA